MNKHILTLFLFIVLVAGGAHAQSYKYQYIKGFSQASNQRFESFLQSTRTLQERKVALFDCDGTLLGQAPHYLLDEALIDYFTSVYGNRTDSLARAKMDELAFTITHSEDEFLYAQKMCDLCAGLTIKEQEDMGRTCFQRKFPNQIFPEMRQVISNLRNFGFEVYVVTASSEYIYEGLCHDQLGIPIENVLGVKALIKADGTATSQLVLPTPVQYGKAQAVRTFIKATPLFVAGNSRGDYEMMSLSKGLKLIINPDDTKPLDLLGGKTLKAYWQGDPNCIVEQTNEVPTPGVKEWSCDRYGLGRKPSHVKK